MSSKNDQLKTRGAVASTDLLGAAYRGSDGAMTCALCAYEMEWEECQALGCEDGYYDAYDENPIFYNPGDMATCPECNGRGGDWWCPNSSCATKMATRILREPPRPSAPNTEVSDSADNER